MVSNCSLYALKPLDPSIDPAYVDGLPPRLRVARHLGEIPTERPVPRIPGPLRRMQTISIEALEDEIEREAACEEE